MCSWVKQISMQAWRCSKVAGCAVDGEEAISEQSAALKAQPEQLPQMKAKRRNVRIRYRCAAPLPRGIF